MERCRGLACELAQQKRFEGFTFNAEEIPVQQCNWDGPHFDRQLYNGVSDAGGPFGNFAEAAAASRRAGARSGGIVRTPDGRWTVREGQTLVADGGAGSVAYVKQPGANCDVVRGVLLQPSDGGCGWDGAHWGRMLTGDVSGPYATFAEAANESRLAGTASGGITAMLSPSGVTEYWVRAGVALVAEGAEGMASWLKRLAKCPGDPELYVQRDPVRTVDVDVGARRDFSTRPEPPLPPDPAIAFGPGDQPRNLGAIPDFTVTAPPPPPPPKATEEGTGQAVIVGAVLIAALLLLNQRRAQ
jgi:hypothetical protein